MTRFEPDLVPNGSDSVPADSVPVPSALKVPTGTGEPGTSHGTGPGRGTKCGNQVVPALDDEWLALYQAGWCAAIEAYADGAL